MRRDADEMQAALALSKGAIGAEPVNDASGPFWPRVNGRAVITPDMPAGGYDSREAACRAAAAHQRQARLYLAADAA